MLPISLKDLVTSSGEFPGQFGSNGKFVFVNGSNRKNIFVNWGHWQFVHVDGSDWQVVTLGLETGLIGNPGQSEFLAFRGDPIGRSLVGVAVNILVLVSCIIVAVRVLGVNDTGADLLLGLGFFPGGAVRSNVAGKKSSGDLVIIVISFKKQN